MKCHSPVELHASAAYCNTILEGRNTFSEDRIAAFGKIDVQAASCICGTGRILSAHSWQLFSSFHCSENECVH